MDENGAPPSKLTSTKQLWAAEGRFLTGRHARPEAERLPPGQHLVRNWPVLDLGQEPEVPLARWRLDVTGLVEKRPALAKAVSWLAYGVVRVAMGFLGYGGNEWWRGRRRGGAFAETIGRFTRGGK